MPEFPKLSSGATVQYPLRRVFFRSVRTLTFLDGCEQRFAAIRPIRRWMVNLALLTEDEAARVDEFVRQYFDTLEPFEFVDPVDGRSYSRCVLEGEENLFRAEGDSRLMTALLIAEDLS